MEKQTLLEKLKTLNQWQLQQQLHFAKLQIDVENSDKNSPLANNKENVNYHNNKNKKNIPNQSSTFMQTMNRNALTSALQSLDNCDNISRGHSHEETGGDDTSLNNWHLSGLQTVKFMSTRQTDSNDVVISGGEEFSDFDDEVINYQDEDGVKPFSETEEENEEEEGPIVKRSQYEPLLQKHQMDSSNKSYDQPLQEHMEQMERSHVNRPPYLKQPSSQQHHQIDTLVSDVVSRNTGLRTSQPTLHHRDDVESHEYNQLSSSEGESDDDNECTIIHNDNNVRYVLIAILSYLIY